MGQLKVCWLAPEKQLIGKRLRRFAKNPQVNTQPQEADQIHGLLGGNAPTVSQDAVSTTDVVEQHGGFLLHLGEARVLFVLNDLEQNLVDAFDDVVLWLTQGHLVGDLKDIAQRLGALAIEPAHRQSQLVDGLDDLVDLLGQDQARKVQHGAHADAGAQIGGAGCQEPVTLGEGELDLLLQGRIDSINGHPGLAQLKPGPQCLHPQMVLFVDHHTNILLSVQHDAAAGVLGRVFAADEVTLHQDLLVQGG